MDGGEFSNLTIYRIADGIAVIESVRDRSDDERAILLHQTTHDALTGLWAFGLRAIALRDFRPERARSKPPADTIQHPPIIDASNAAGLLGNNGDMINHSWSVSS